MTRIYLAFAVLLAAMLALAFFPQSLPHTALPYAWGGLTAVAVLFLAYFHRRVVRPLHVIGNGMQLLREQDFSSRLHSVGVPETDRIVEIFNQMMHKLREERLQLLERNRLLDLLVEVSPMGVAMLDFDGRITALNPAAMQFLECKADYQGKTFADLPGDLAQRIAAQKDETTETFSMSDAHIYRSTRSCFIDRGFNHPFVLIESLTHEVMDAEREAYGKVIRMISHEVNNTVAGVSSIMETVGDELQALPGTEELCTALQACVGRSMEMSAFIKRFAEVVKLPEPSLQPMPLNSLVTANLQFLESLCHTHDISLRTSLCTEDPEVRMDVAQMTQTLVNIVRNAVESIADQERTDRLGEVVITTTADPLTLTIADNGAGIAPEAEPKLFSPFFSTKPNGNGIGLLLSREVLTRHQFRFSLKTGADGITRFRILF